MAQKSVPEVKISAKERAEPKRIAKEMEKGRKHSSEKVLMDMNKILKWLHNLLISILRFFGILNPYARDSKATTLEGLQAELSREEIRSEREMQATNARVILIPILASFYIFLTQPIALNIFATQAISGLQTILIILLPLFAIGAVYTLLNENMHEEITAQIVYDIDKAAELEALSKQKHKRK